MAPSTFVLVMVHIVAESIADKLEKELLLKI